MGTSLKFKKQGSLLNNLKHNLLFTLVDNLLFEVAVVSWCVSQYSKSIKER